LRFDGSATLAYTYRRELESLEQPLGHELPAVVRVPVPAVLCAPAVVLLPALVCTRRYPFDPADANMDFRFRFAFESR
jgi:hypothetical protein